jgi:hypothetical protein
MRGEMKRHPEFDSGGKLRAVWLTVTLVLWLPAFPCLLSAADDQETALHFHSFFDQTPGLQIFLYGLIIISALLLGANAANLVLTARSIPGRLAERIVGYITRDDLEGLQSLIGSQSNRLSQSFKPGLKSGPDGIILDKAAVIASWQALAGAFSLLPRALKAYAVMALALAGGGLGIELLRLYSDVYIRINTTLGYIPLRELFQQGSAKIIIIGLVGLAVFVTTLVSGFLFSGAVKIILARRTSKLIDLLGRPGQAVDPDE